VVRIDVEGDCWRTEDHYLDLIVRPGRGVDVVDTDELLDAVLAGLLDPATAQEALTTTYRTVDGLARHGYLLDRWLSTVGMRPTWSRR
jgi:predicted RNA-binding protein associated with RNAse of E/G family